MQGVGNEGGRVLVLAAWLQHDEPTSVISIQ